MRKKITQNAARELFESSGYKLLDQYKYGDVKMTCICNNGHETKISYSNFKHGKRCVFCAKEKLRKSCQHSYKYVQKYFKDHECELISCVYINSKQLLEYKCSCGKIAKIQFNNFCNGQRCYSCGKNKRIQKRKLPYDKIKSLFSDNGCKLLTIEYNNTHQLLDYICICGTKSKISYDNFKDGHRCYNCGVKKISERFKGEKHHFWIKDRKKYNEYHLFRRKCKSIINNCLKNYSEKKNYNKSADLLGYSSEQLRNHIQSHENWNTLKNEKWSIDHIFPIKAFYNYNVRDLKLINCLENLQPMLSSENSSKCDSYNKDEFESWLKSKGYNL